MKRNWHLNFMNYMELIVNHDNYAGLPITRNDNGDLNWVATAKSSIGQRRKEWALQKANQLGISGEAGVYAKVMLEIHPTKQKVCQICGETMSLYYIYLNNLLVKSILKEFKLEYSNLNSLSDVYDDLKEKGNKENKINSFLINKFKLNVNENMEKDDIIQMCEYKCRSGNSKFLGPGAMSNFPDRYDGFHTYNRCCRSSNDTGRSKDNLKSYTKDRRAYELWSDGNIHAANKFMGSNFFNGASADHVGPISLGFKHDSNFLRKMSSGENSAKRDRLQLEDVTELIKIEQNTDIIPMSWYSKLIWIDIKQKYMISQDLTKYRLILKQNVANYMTVLWNIKKNENGVEFLLEKLLKSKYKCFNYNYTFNEFGNVLTVNPRNITDSTKKEFERFVRIALDSLNDYNSKINRNVSLSITKDNYLQLNKILQYISNKNFDNAFIHLEKLFITLQQDLIKSI